MIKYSKSRNSAIFRSQISRATFTHRLLRDTTLHLSASAISNFSCFFEFSNSDESECEHPFPAIDHIRNTGKWLHALETCQKGTFNFYKLTNTWPTKALRLWVIFLTNIEWIETNIKRVSVVEITQVSVTRETYHDPTSDIIQVDSGIACVFGDGWRFPFW